MRQGRCPDNPGREQAPCTQKKIEYQTVMDLSDELQASSTAVASLSESMENWKARRAPTQPDFNPKDILGMLRRVASRLRANAWRLRSDIVWCLSGGAFVYAKTQKGEMPMMVKDLVRLKPSTVELWNGAKWSQASGWSKSARPDRPIEIVLRSGERIGCTPGHDWPTQRGRIRADMLKVGDVISTCGLPEPGNPASPGHIPDEIGWFVGLYLAEGSWGKDGTVIQIASHIMEEERYRRLSAHAYEYGGTCRRHLTSNKGCTINIYCPLLAAVLETFIHGNTARNKGLKVACWQRSNRFLCGLAQGYLDGDAHDDHENNRWKLGFTRNYRLESDLRTLAARLGARILLRPVVSKIAEKPYPSFRGEWRWSVSDHHNTISAGEIVAIRNSRARKFWDIGVTDEPRLFALASGVLTHISKPNPMSESVTCGRTSSHEHVFILSKCVW